MSISEIIKAECKNQKIPVSRMEKDLGFCNGYVRGLKDKIPLDRAKDISNYLNIDMKVLLREELDPVEIDGIVSDIRVHMNEEAFDSTYYTDPATIALAQEMASRPGMKTLFEASRDLSEEDLQIVNQLVLKLSEKK